LPGRFIANFQAVHDAAFGAFLNDVATRCLRALARTTFTRYARVTQVNLVCTDTVPHARMAFNVWNSFLPYGEPLHFTFFISPVCRCFLDVATAPRRCLRTHTRPYGLGTRSLSLRRLPAHTCFRCLFGRLYARAPARRGERLRRFTLPLSTTPAVARAFSELVERR